MMKHGFHGLYGFHRLHRFIGTHLKNLCNLCNLWNPCNLWFPYGIILLAFACSLAIYLLTLVLPYNVFDHVHRAPISLTQIAEQRHRPALLFLLTFASTFGWLILAYRACQRAPRRGLVAPILACGLIMAMALAFTYPIGAGDVVDYVAQGETLAFFGANPLVVPPANVPGALLAGYSAYRYSTSNYGPLWTWIGAAVVRMAGNASMLPALLGFKAVAVLAYLAQGLLVYAILRRRDPARAPAGVLFFAWNPLVLYEFAVNGHNDAAMMALALLGILFWQMDRPLPMVIALTAAFLVKVPMLPLLPLFLLSAARRRAGRRFWTTLIAGGLLAVALTGLAYLSLPSAPSTLTNLWERSGLFTFSLPTLASLALRLAGLEEGRAQMLARSGALLALGIWYVIQAVRTWQRPNETLRHAFDFLLFWLLFAVLWFQPWYVTWLVALAALSPRPTAAAQAGLFSFTVLPAYIVYGFVWFWIAHIANWANCLGINLIAVGISIAPVWAYTALSRSHLRSSNRYDIVQSRPTGAPR